MKDKSDNLNEQENLVITPGGPRRKELVHSVGPSEAVYIDESGNARVIPREQEGEVINMAEDMVLTPGGYRPRSLIHVIEPGHVLDGSGGRLRKRDPSGQVVADFGLITSRPGIAAALGTGWISDAFWTNTTGTPISSFTATWVVPPPPTTQSGQLIYLFNGIQPSDSSWIYQPVLQWGISEAGGGNNWAVASWYVAQPSQGGQAFSSELTPVNPGDTLVGVMTLTRQSGSSFNYDSQFQGIANSGLQIQGVAELTTCYIAMEAYQITLCSDYPNTQVMAFTGINIQTGGSTPTVSWTPDNKVTDCGQHAVVVINSGTNGEVDLDISIPVVTGINPTSGSAAGGDTVTITGSGFTGATAVNFGSVAASSFNVDSDTQITATSPAANASGAVDVTVTTPFGTSATSSADQFTYLTPVPTVTGINPTSGSAAGGDTVTITGSGFTGATAVNFGSVAASSFNVDSDTQITATSPAGSGTVDVTVTTPNGTSATSSADQFTYNSVPVVTGITPTSGSAAGGDTVTITGSGFTGATSVGFGNTGAPSLSVDSDTQITTTSPPGSGTVDVTVITPGGTSATSSADQFTYLTPVPTVTGINPTSGSAAGGDTVTITGTGFTGATAVNFDSVAASSFNVDSDTQITATSPAANASGAVDVTVTTPNGTSATSSADQFTYM